MMNLTISHPVPTFGDSFTVTCYVCGMPSSKEWAQKARSRPTTPMKPYFPFLLQIVPTGGAVLREDGSTFLCAFCHALLESQWGAYENQQVVPPPNRKYNIQKFICAICGVETYRKRIRALPFQEFPFLEKQRQPGSITLGNNPLAVVCLDCSETLWAQSAEYDRWGLPVQKRHFNWMARPPPPEDSVEATVARLPSGETQLPRCPPTEPSIGHPKVVDAPKHIEMPVTKSRGKGKGDSPKMENSHTITSPIPQTPGRKSSITTPPSIEMVGGFHNQQPPVVTVAPMSSHTTVISLRKDSMGIPPGLITQAAPGVYPQTTPGVYPPATPYSPYVWVAPGSREASQRTIEPYPYAPAASDTLHGPPGAWPWLPHPTPDMLRYQNYVSSLQNRSITESSRSPPNGASSSSTVVYRSGDSPPRYQTSPSTSTIISGIREHDKRSTTALARRLGPGSASGGSSDDLSYPSKASPDPKTGKRSPKALARETEMVSRGSRSFSSQPKKLSKDETVATVDATPGNRSPSSSDERSRVSPPSSLQPSAVADDQEKFHIPKKRNWQVFMKDSPSLASSEETKQEEEFKSIPHPKKKKSSVTSIESIDISSSRTSASDSAIDLTTSLGGSPSDLPSTGKGATSTKFRIEYLCQSENSSQASGDDAIARTSVIKCAPKVPPTVAEDASQTERQPDQKKAGEVQSFESTKETSSPKDTPAEGAASTSTGAICGDGDDKVLDSKMMVTCVDEQAVKEESDENQEGNSDRQDQDSTMKDDDVDETKNEDLPNIEQFIKEAVSELVTREKEQEKMKQETVDKQKEFLSELGLITPEKKTELEIKSIVSRHERKTLPPLKLRANTRLGRKIDKQLKELLLKVSLEDPTLFHGKPETDKCDFMAELGMKTAEKSDKTRREIKWRVILMERMRRELRDATTRGVKHEWEKSEILKKFADCDLESFFSSVSFTALQKLESEKKIEDCVKEELLSNTNESSDDTENNNATSPGVCINYPKYVPSYAAASCSTTPEEKEAASEGNVGTETILKIPVVPSKRHIPSESSANSVASDNDDSELNAGDDKSVASLQLSLPGLLPPTGLAFGAATSQPYPLRIDNLIQCSANYWEQMKRNIDDILNELESSKEDVPLEHKTDHVDKIRKHLKSQLSDIKEIEKRLRTTGKTILNVSRKKSPRKE